MNVLDAAALRAGADAAVAAGPGERERCVAVSPFVVAEIGVNHNGDRALAERLIDVAGQAGADAVMEIVAERQAYARYPHGEVMARKPVNSPPVPEKERPDWGVVGQARQAFVTEILTFVPLLLVPLAIWGHPLAMALWVVLTAVAVETTDRSQLNFYRSRAAKYERDDETDHHKYFEIADNWRTLSRLLRIAAVAVPLGLAYPW